MDKYIILDHCSYKQELSDVTFTIQKGELVGIIGLEKSGKDCIFEIISGLLKVDSGFVSIIGYDPFLKTNDFKKQISYIGEKDKEINLKLKPIEILEITKLLYDVNDRDFRKNINDLTKYTNDVNLLNSLLFNPKVLLIDNSEIDLNLIDKYIQKNNTVGVVNLTSLDGISNLIRRVIILDNGKVFYDGVVDEIFDKYANEKVIKIKLADVLDFNLFNSIGTVIKHIHPYVYLKVPRSVINYAAAEVIQNFSVLSLSIEELPISEVLENMKR